MLSSIHIENIAVIKTADIDFGDGFNVLTGETGAGKSILIDSINLILGARPSKDLIRSGENKASVSVMFTDVKELLKRLPPELDITPDEDGCLYLTRTVDIDGKAQTRLNGRTIPVSLQKELAGYLISIHGQHDNSLLLSPSAHIEYLDNYSGLGDKLAEYGVYYDKMLSCRHRISQLSRDERDKARTIELLRYQIEEIDSARLKPDEEQNLEERRIRMRNSEKIMKQTRLVTRAPYRNDKTLPAYELVKKSMTALESVREYVPQAGEYIERLAAVSYELEDIGIAMSDYSETDYGDPVTELDKIETRLDQISKLEKKYGTDISQVLAFREKAAAELDNIELSDVMTAELKRELEGYEKEAIKLSSEITEIRKKYAKELEIKTIDELVYLEMPKVRFKVDVKRTISSDGKMTLGRRGGDEVQFLISANPGEPLKPIAKIASGGELSRIMLALKSVNAADTPGQTLIFDEIDAGVSGKTSQKIGILLRSLAKNNQVICVTHSAQIAAEAHSQYLIRKTERDDRVETEVIPLDRDGRVKEIARIMGGVNITEKLLQSAEEMLDSAEIIK